MHKLKRGFTFLEVVIALAILSIALVGLASMQMLYGQQTYDRTRLNSIVDAVSAALSQCQAGITPTNPATYNGVTVSMSVSGGSCVPASNTCNAVSATASSGSESITATSYVCNFQ
ncbi:MAG: prepilin-type N-terminal cleavage/methylation domain-containing protein [Dissulfurispiraceae bacterium]